MKHTQFVDWRGVPQAVRTAGENVSDHRQITPLVPKDSRVGSELSRPKKLPGGLFAQQGYYA